MKKFYETPDVEYIDFKINDYIMNAGLDYSVEIGEDEEEGLT